MARTLRVPLSAALLLCGDFASPQAVVETAPSDDPSGVTVTDSGNRVTYTLPYFARYNVVTARDMLVRIPGAQGVLDGGGGGGGDQRGFGNSGDQVLINGKRLSGKSIDIGSTIGRIPARQIERIEVIRGAVEGLDVRSRGRVVNLVLTETLVTGYGSWQGSWSHYSDGRTAPGAEVNYSGHLGAMNYVLAAEGRGRNDGNVGTDYFYTPDDTLFERQAEGEVEESDERSFTANTSLSFANGDILNLNGLYSREDEDERQRSEVFDIVAGDESFIREVSIVSEDARRNWELGGDYERVLRNGNVLTGIFVSTSSSGNEQGQLQFTAAGEPRDVDELQFEHQRSTENILRGTYDWGITETRSFESGAEIAVNTVDSSIELFEDRDGDGVLEEIVLFNWASEVQETRVEAFTTYTLRATEDLLVEASLDIEASQLKQQGADLSRSRDFFFTRPRVVLRYDVTDQAQLRARVERTVNQLDFGAFTASFTNDDNRLDVISAGNPELVPETAWNYELTYERRLAGDAGFVSVTGRYRDVEDKEGRIPLLIRDPDGELEERTAPGNIGDGRQIDLEVNASVRLGWLNLDRAVLEGSVELTDTEVTDPFTGQKRDYDFLAPYEWRLSFRHDTTWRGFSYGFETGNGGSSKQFDRDYRQASKQDSDFEIFAELQPMRNLTLRLEVEDVLRAESERERLQYVGNRGDGLLERREVRLSKPLREITLSVEGVF